VVLPVYLVLVSFLMIFILEATQKPVRTGQIGDFNSKIALNQQNYPCEHKHLCGFGLDINLTY
jgi:hypothetical protein